MPSGYLHQCCALQACQAAGITPVEQSVMIFGAQGPDPLFLLGIFPLRLSSRPDRLGNLIHSYRTGAFLRALCRRAKDGTSVQRAYALGFLTHYALDSNVHPYVYAHSLKPSGAYSSTMHMALEKSWDVLYYRRDGHTGTPVIMPCAEEARPHWQAIAALVSETVREVFPERGDVTDALIHGALSDTARANRLTHSPRGIKYRIVWLLERLIGKPRLATSQMVPTKPMAGDITNSTHSPWHSPFAPQEARDEGLTELFEAGLHRAAALLSAAAKYFADELDAAQLADVIGNAGYDTGLESKESLEDVQ